MQWPMLARRSYLTSTEERMTLWTPCGSLLRYISSYEQNKPCPPPPPPYRHRGCKKTLAQDIPPDPKMVGRTGNSYWVGMGHQRARTPLPSHFYEWCLASVRKGAYGHALAEKQGSGTCHVCFLPRSKLLKYCTNRLRQRRQGWGWWPKYMVLLLIKTE